MSPSSPDRICKSDGNLALLALEIRRTPCPGPVALSTMEQVRIRRGANLIILQQCPIVLPAGYFPHLVPVQTHVFSIYSIVQITEPENNVVVMDHEAVGKLEL